MTAAPRLLAGLGTQAAGGHTGTGFARQCFLQFPVVQLNKYLHISTTALPPTHSHGWCKLKSSAAVESLGFNTGIKSLEAAFQPR